MICPVIIVGVLLPLVFIADWNNVVNWMYWYIICKYLGIEACFSYEPTVCYPDSYSI